MRYGKKWLPKMKEKELNIKHVMNVLRCGRCGSHASILFWTKVCIQCEADCLTIMGFGVLLHVIDAHWIDTNQLINETCLQPMLGANGKS